MLDLDPATTALVVVDMQNDFVRQGAPLEVPDARGTIDNHRRLLKCFRDRKGVVVFTRFIAGPRRTLIWNWSARIGAADLLLLARFHAHLRRRRRTA